eukprot:Amastigsp_a8039_21.p5 type:complete len:121 gc:universal Amastigsp_a8039_21:946-1308(+)
MAPSSGARSPDLSSMTATILNGDNATVGVPAGASVTSGFTSPNTTPPWVSCTETMAEQPRLARTWRMSSGAICWSSDSAVVFSGGTKVAAPTSGAKTVDPRSSASRVRTPIPFQWLRSCW